MSLNAYKKFLVYKEILKDRKITLIARKYGVARNTVYKIEKEGFFKIGDDEKNVLDYVERYPFASVRDIMDALGLKKDFVYRTLNKFNVVVFREMSNEEVEIAKFLLEKENYKDLNDFLYYNNFEFMECLNTDFEYLRFLNLYYRALNNDDVLDELENLLNNLKIRGMNFTYLKALFVKLDLIAMRKNYKEVIKVIESLTRLDNLISISLKARYYMLYISVLGRSDEFKKGFEAIGKLENVYVKLPDYEKDEAIGAICSYYYSFGNIRKAYEFSSKDSISHVFALYGLGKYKDIINYKFNFNDPHLNYLYTYNKSFSYLFLNKPQLAIETMISIYDIKNIKFESYLEYYYSFMIAYHKYFGNAVYLKFFEELKNRLDDKIDRHLYAIISGDTSKLKNTPKDKIIKYYIEGKLYNALYFARKYGLINTLNLLFLFHPKSLIRIKKYKEFKGFINFAIRPKIKLYLLRKRPFFVYKNKKFYLRDRGNSIELIKLLVNSRIGIWHFTKDEIKYMKYKIKLPIEQVGNEIVLNADVYLDFKEAELSYKSGDMRRFNRLFEALPFALDYHFDGTINNIIVLFKNLRK